MASCRAVAGVGDVIYYRFSANSSTTYDAMRAAADLRLGLVAPATCIPAASSAPRDQEYRIVLAVNEYGAVYQAILPELSAMLASGASVPISREEYFASFEIDVSSGSDYSLPTASASVLGGVRIGSGVSIDGSGVISVSTNYAAASHTHVASAISDSTTAGRALLTAADAAAQRTALGLGSLATLSSVGTSQIADGAITTAKLADGAVTHAKTSGIQKAITYGTTAPTGGTDGDIYIQYPA